MTPPSARATSRRWDTLAAKLDVGPAQFGALMAPLAWEPQPTTAWLFGIRGPYTSIAVYEEWLRCGAGRGLLDEIAPGVHCVTEQGRSACRTMLDAARAAMELSGPYLRAEAERFAALLKKLVEACLSAPPPPEKVYAAALGELRARGWLTGSDDAPQLTEAGRAARAEIERRTDEMFYGPWAALSQTEQTELLPLAQAIREALR